MGVTCWALWATISLGIILRSQTLLWLSLFCGGIAFWVAAFLIFTQGVMGHTGCMEAPFMAYAAVNMWIQASITRNTRR
jgi:hypothetical protein